MWCLVYAFCSVLVCVFVCDICIVGVCGSVPILWLICGLMCMVCVCVCVCVVCHVRLTVYVLCMYSAFYVCVVSV